MIYLDHAATTPLAPAVLEAMRPFLETQFGNASSVHRLGRAARHAVEEARARVAHVIGAEPAEIVFTSGGTEADNLALRGMLRPGDGLVTGATEHEAIRHTADLLADAGHPVTVLPPGPSGAVEPENVTAHLGPATRLVSLMHVNNETGAITSVEDVARVCRAAGVYFHTDAVQSAGHLPLHVDTLGVDLMTLSAHKVNGPKGAGALYVRSGTPLDPILTGGQQERGRRGGTENVAALVGFAVALERAVDATTEWAARLSARKAHLLDRLRSTLGDRFVVNTPATASPHILNIAFPPMPQAVDGEMLLLNLDLEGVLVSAGSACTSGALSPSHVLLALGLDRPTASAALRFSLGPSTSEDEIDRAAEAVGRVARRMHLTD